VERSAGGGYSSRPVHAFDSRGTARRMTWRKLLLLLICCAFAFGGMIFAKTNE
jgi:hypothetical protein